MEVFDVAIVGAGPTGLAAARRLADQGCRSLVVLEREAQAGGIPRHCGHGGFGWASHRRWWSGPRYAQALRESVRELDVRTGTTVLALQPGGFLRICDRHGTRELAARQVLIATGARESPRAARLVGGTRPRGVMTTGTLQQLVYLHGQKPFARPLVVGSEWVALSVLATCRHLGIRPVALIEAGSRAQSPRGAALLAQVLFGVPLLTDTRLVSIEGRSAVEAAQIDRASRLERLVCDGVVFSGQFRPENALFGDGRFSMSELSPRVDRLWRCSDTAYFAAGNVLGPLKSSGRCWQQGIAAAEAMLDVRV